MSKRPHPVTALSAEGRVSAIDLSWNLPGWVPLVDHVAVHASTSPEVEVSEDTLLGKTVYGRFTHDTLGPRAQTRYYQLVTVDEAGRRSGPSVSVQATSAESMVVRGRPLAQVGEFDSTSLELALAPDEYARFDTMFPNGVDFRYPDDDPGTGWSYLHPGPQDAWSDPAGRTFRLRFPLESVPSADPGLAVWLIDTHATKPGTATVSVNGADAAEIEFHGGATRGSLEGDATVQDTALKPSFEEVTLPARHFTSGENTVTIHKTAGSWHAYDAVGVFDLSG